MGIYTDVTAERADNWRERFELLTALIATSVLWIRSSGSARDSLADHLRGEGAHGHGRGHGSDSQVGARGAEWRGPGAGPAASRKTRPAVAAPQRARAQATS
jgi:hypothetical protein